MFIHTRGKKMYRKSIALALSSHGANSSTRELQSMVEEVVSKIPMQLADQLVKELNESSTTEQLENTPVWQKVQAYLELRKSSTRTSYYSNSIALALSSHGANSSTRELQSMVEEVVSKIPMQLADQLVKELNESSTTEQLENTPVWQKVQAYLELRK